MPKKGKKEKEKKLTKIKTKLKKKNFAQGRIPWAI